MNLIFCAYAYKDDFQSGHNIQTADNKNIYLKNSYVALKSSKLYNPDADVALITNISLNEYWEKLFSEAGILVMHADFNDFIFEKEYGWSLAFYKLCALKYALSQNYSKIALIDTDVYVQRTFDDIWRECDDNVLLCDISRGLYNGDYRVFFEEAQHFLNTSEILTRYGGEFVAGNSVLLKKFVDKCEEIYLNMKENKFKTINGDEFIESIAAWEMKDKIKNAAAYVFRYWTAYRWHYVCSNYRSNPVCILHCPREKDYGFVKIFKYMSKHKETPPITKIYKWLHLDLFSYIRIEILKNLLNLKNK